MTSSHSTHFYKKTTVATVFTYRKRKTVCFLHSEHFHPKDFSIKLGVAGHVMQSQTIFKMKFEDFLIMVSPNLLDLGYLKKTLL